MPQSGDRTSNVDISFILKRQRPERWCLVKMSKVVIVELFDKEGGTNIADKWDVEKISEQLYQALPGRILRNYWILVLTKGRTVESYEEFTDRIKKEVKKWNSEIVKKNAEIAKQLDAQKAKEKKNQYVS